MFSYRSVLALTEVGNTAASEALPWHYHVGKVLSGGRLAITNTSAHRLASLDVGICLPNPLLSTCSIIQNDFKLKFDPAKTIEKPWVSMFSAAHDSWMCSSGFSTLKNRTAPWFYGSNTGPGWDPRLSVSGHFGAPRLHQGEFITGDLGGESVGCSSMIFHSISSMDFNGWYMLDMWLDRWVTFIGVYYIHSLTWHVGP